jgi:type I restriction enzyme R subunit
LASFLAGRNLSANQIEFVDLIINELTECGVVTIASLYDSPYTDVSPRGPDGLFRSEEIDQLAGILNDIRERAAA